MASRERLSKLKVDSLRQLAAEHGLQTTKVKKEALISNILNCQAPVSALTPVINVSEQDAMCPQIEEKENVPPFHRVSYGPIDSAELPTLTFTNIYNFMCNRKVKSGGQVGNFKGLDRAVNHMDAGDVQEISAAQSSNIHSPRGLHVTKTGGVVLCGFGSDNIQLIGPNEEWAGDILGRQDSIIGPQDVALNEANDMMAVTFDPSSGNSDIVKLFKITLQ